MTEADVGATGEEQGAEDYQGKKEAQFIPARADFPEGKKSEQENDEEAEGDFVCGDDGEVIPPASPSSR